MDRTVIAKITSDIVCPWCFVGRESLLKAARAKNVELRITWLPYFLNKDSPKPGEKLPIDKYVDQTYGEGTYLRTKDRMQQAADAYKLNIKFISERSMVNSEAAHRLSYLSIPSGKQDRLMGELFRKYFEEGEDIGNETVLENIAIAIGIDKEIIDAWKAGEGAKEVENRTTAGKLRGITAVPFFMLENRLGQSLSLSGGLPPGAFMEAFSDLLEHGF